MFEKLKLSVVAVALSALMAVGAAAAPVTYTVETTSMSFSSACADGFCNAQLTTPAIPGGGGTVDTGVTNTFETFRFRSLLNFRIPFFTFNETLNIAAQVVLNVGGTSYAYGASGVITGWTVGPLGRLLGNPQLSWTSFTVPNGSPLSVLFNEALEPVAGTNRTVFSTITVALNTSETSAVPLPAGMVLLLTSLLGLLGLSRRKRTLA